MTAGKTCPQCRECKPLSDYYFSKARAKGRKDGYSGWCKVCVLRWKHEHPQPLNDRRRETLRRYHQNLPPEKRAAKAANAAAWAVNNPEKHLAGVRRRLLHKLYNLSVEGYDRLLAEQDGKCLICSIPADETTQKRLCVDHCHNTGHVRGLLCSNCNTAIGMARDNPAFLEAAATYLRRESER